MKEVASFSDLNRYPLKQRVFLFTLLTNMSMVEHVEHVYAYGDFLSSGNGLDLVFLVVGDLTEDEMIHISKNCPPDYSTGFDIAHEIYFYTSENFFSDEYDADKKICFKYGFDFTGCLHQEVMFA